MASPRANHTATLLPNGKVLVAGGYDIDIDANLRLLSTAEVYDPATGTWSHTGSMARSVEPSTPSTLLPNGKVLVAGTGNDGGGVRPGLGHLELYRLSA